MYHHQGRRTTLGSGYVVQVAVLNSTGGAHLEYPVAQNFSEFWFRLILLDTLGQIWGHLIRPQTFFKRVWAAKHAKTQADLNRQWRDKPVRPFLLYRQMLRVVTVPLLIGYVKLVFILSGRIRNGLSTHFSFLFRYVLSERGLHLSTGSPFWRGSFSMVCKSTRFSDIVSSHRRSVSGSRRK